MPSTMPSSWNPLFTGCFADTAGTSPTMSTYWSYSMRYSRFYFGQDKKSSDDGWMDILEIMRACLHIYIFIWFNICKSSSGCVPCLPGSCPKSVEIGSSSPSTLIWTKAMLHKSVSQYLFFFFRLQTSFQTELGQALDLMTAPPGHFDLNRFTMERQVEDLKGIKLRKQCLQDTIPGNNLISLNWCDFYYYYYYSIFF